MNVDELKRVSYEIPSSRLISETDSVDLLDRSMT